MLSTSVPIFIDDVLLMWYGTSFSKLIVSKCNTKLWNLHFMLITHCKASVYTVMILFYPPPLSFHWAFIDLLITEHTHNGTNQNK